MTVLICTINEFLVCDYELMAFSKHESKVMKKLQIREGLMFVDGAH